jgi:hypothetical protein
MQEFAELDCVKNVNPWLSMQKVELFPAFLSHAFR